MSIYTYILILLLLLRSLFERKQVRRYSKKKNYLTKWIFDSKCKVIDLPRLSKKNLFSFLRSPYELKQLNSLEAFGVSREYTKYKLLRFYYSVKHPFHILKSNLWPFFLSIAITTMLFGIVLYFHRYEKGFFIASFGLVFTILILIFWFGDIINEGFLKRQHTRAVRDGLRLGMKLFILSEVMFFFAIFWAFFHSSINPTIQIGVWPPRGVIGIVLNYFDYGFRRTEGFEYGFDMPRAFNEIISLRENFRKKVDSGEMTAAEFYKRGFWDFFSGPENDYTNSPSARKEIYKIHFGDFIWVPSDARWMLMYRWIFDIRFFSLSYVFSWIGVPLLNTIILVASGLAVTWAHKAIKGDLWLNAVVGLYMTLYLGYSFTYYQYLEYVYLEFKINDGIFGSIFYLATGFHGLHVLVGTIFLIVGFFRLLRFHFTPRIHVGLQCAIWYWHFVDVVWIFLFIFVYMWGLDATTSFLDPIISTSNCLHDEPLVRWFTVKERKNIRFITYLYRTNIDVFTYDGHSYDRPYVYSGDQYHTLLRERLESAAMDKEKADLGHSEGIIDKILSFVYFWKN